MLKLFLSVIYNFVKWARVFVYALQIFEKTTVFVYDLQSLEISQSVCL